MNHTNDEQGKWEKKGNNNNKRKERKKKRKKKDKNISWKRLGQHGIEFPNTKQTNKQKKLAELTVPILIVSTQIIY